MNAPATQTKPLRGENIIAVASGKGGVGKTWFSITLAHLFARAGRRTLLFDGDIGLANVDVQLGLTPQYDLGAVFAGQRLMKDAITHYAPGNFDILAGRSGSTSMASLGAGRMMPAAEQLVQTALSDQPTAIDDAHHVRQPRRHGGLPEAVKAPGDDGAIFFQCQGVVAARR